MYDNSMLSVSNIVSLLLEVNWLRLGSKIQRWMMFWRVGGLYEVLESEFCLELQDTKGKRATFTKKQRVRFLQDNTIAYQDQAWGDGMIFEDYQCSPGIAVDRYREGNRHWVLISLRETKKRGDIETFHIERKIKNGFVHKVEDFQIDINHVTRQATICVVFPAKRTPKAVMLIEQNRKRSIALFQQHFQKLADGRLLVQHEIKDPRVFESYILRWHW